MIEVKKLFKFLKKNKINFFTGVPDSILKETSNYLSNKKIKEHMITANEGSAVALAIGYNLATKKIPCVYLQNSGLGNAINPLISIAHKKIYSIPMILLIGWRGSPGISDEPQHKVKGLITRKLLNLMNIKHCVLKNKSDFKKLKNLIHYSKHKSSPVACLIPKNTFKKVKLNKKPTKKNKFNIKRTNVISNLLKIINTSDKLIATTGFTSRELYQLRQVENTNKGSDFYMVGGMGHASMVSLGVSMYTKKKVICLDGDGSFLMHLGSIVGVSKIKNNNFKHILFNNFSHESVGGQPTYIENLNLKKLINSVNYKNYFKISSKSQVSKTLRKFLNSKGPSFLEVCINQGSIENLGRPKKLINIKNRFIRKF